MTHLVKIIENEKSKPETFSREYVRTHNGVYEPYDKDVKILMVSLEGRLMYVTKSDSELRIIGDSDHSWSGCEFVRSNFKVEVTFQN